MVLLTATSLKNLSQNGKFLLDTESKSVCHTGFVLCCAAFTYGDCIFLCEHQCELCCAQIDGKCLENETRQAL